MVRRHRLRGAALCFSLATCTVGLMALGTAHSETQTAKPGGPGSVLYLTYCESCHGVAGLGDGPAAASLRTPPADLTQLWKRYGTPLDRKRLAEYIDGRMLTSYHGAESREMPIWGEEFFGDAPPDTVGIEGARRHLIRVLVNYLQRLQSEQAT
ncbi:MAG: c-type cytochrome [Myxococcota bacterium]